MKHDGMIAMTSHPYRDAGQVGAAFAPGRGGPAPRWVPSTRYSDRPMDWRARAFGIGGTVGVCLLILGGVLFTWRALQSVVVPPALTVFDVAPPAAPPAPVEEVPEGPKQVERKEQKPREQVDRPEPPKVVIPRLTANTTPSPPPVEQVEAADPVPETTAPKSLPAPPTSRAANNAEATWESLLLAHLGKYRRYPGAARRAGQQGTVYVRFRMNRAGHVLSVSLVRSSGFPALDQAALDTLRRADPLPKIPDDRPDELDLTIPVEFFTRVR